MPSFRRFSLAGYFYERAARDDFSAIYTIFMTLHFRCYHAPPLPAATRVIAACERHDMAPITYMVTAPLIFSTMHSHYAPRLLARQHGHA